MLGLVAPARKDRRRQVYDSEGCRVVAGCVPYRHADKSEEIEVLMVTPHKGDGLLFPKGGWEHGESKEQAACREALEEAGVEGVIREDLGYWNFKSRGHHDEHSSEGSRKGYMFALFVTNTLDSWPEKDDRQRRWVTVTEAMGFLRHRWMKEALEEFDRRLSGSVDDSESSVSLSQSSDEDPSEQSACDDDDIPSFVTEESASSSSE